MSKTNFEFLDALGQIARDKGISVDTLLDAWPMRWWRRTSGAGRGREPCVTIDPTRGDRSTDRARREGNVIREWDDTPETSATSPARRPSRSSAADRGRARPEVRRVRRPRGRHHTASSSRPTTATPCSTSARSRHCCPRPSRSPTSAMSTGARLKAYIVEVRKTTKGPQIVVSAATPASSSGCSSWRFLRSPSASSRSRPRRESQDTGRRSPCGPTTTTSTRSVHVSVRVAREFVW